MNLRKTINWPNQLSAKYFNPTKRIENGRFYKHQHNITINLFPKRFDEWGSVSWRTVRFTIQTKLKL